MKILIRDVRTGYYLQETGGWTEYAEHAGDFPSSAAALNARMRWRVADAQLVFRFDREGHSITVPLEPISEGARVDRQTREPALEPA